MQIHDRQGPSPTLPHDGERDSLVGLYFRDASRHELLSDDAERRLARQLIRSLRVISQELCLPDDTPQTLREVVGSLGDACAFSSRCRRAYHLAMACRRRLIQCNLRLAVHIARRYNQHGIPMSDLIQDANVGLIKAVERYDAYSRPRLPLIPDEVCHPFHAKAATNSTAKLPPQQTA